MESAPVDQGRVTEPLLPRVKRAVAAFNDSFGTPPRWCACAPGRVNLIGEHVDYNDGFVLPMGIDRQTVIVAGPRSRSGHRAAGSCICSLELNEVQMLPLPSYEAPRETGWLAYVQGVCAGFETLDCKLEPLNLVIDSTVPIGGGLSSSASLEVAMATLLEEVTGTSLDALDKIRLCQQAEHDFANVPCGIMDQFAATLSRENQLMLLDCRSLRVEMIPLEPPAPAILVVNTNVRHALGESQYALRRRECEQAAQALSVGSLRDVSSCDLTAQRHLLDPTIYQRAHHVVTEIDRTIHMAKAIRQRDWVAAGELLYASHDSLKNDYAVTCDELDLLVSLSQRLGTSAGIYGTRMTGGGFGGCTVSLVQADQVDRVARTLSESYQRQTSIEPTYFVTQPAEGARMLDLSSIDLE